MLVAVDWTNVLDSLIGAAPAIIAAAVAAVYAARSHGQIQTPSGDPIGHVVERTHDLAAVATLAVAGTEAAAPLAKTVDRLNDDAGSPVKVNGETEAAAKAAQEAGA